MHPGFTVAAAQVIENIAVHFLAHEGLEQVSFSYEPGVRILDNVNFKAKAGDSFAIVGPTGAGKTTLVNLLSRFYNLER